MKIKRPNMAKDVIKKKQRIAHNKANESHEMYPDDDILTSIMQDMDNSNVMAAMCLGKYQTDLSETSKSTFIEKIQSNVNHIASQSHTSLPKLKRLGLCRKGPLMEKCQRTLMLLQHNRKQPKPRAHLAGLSNSQSFNNSVSTEKSKTKNMNNVRNSKFRNKVANEKQVYNSIATDRNKMKKNSIESKSEVIASKKLKPSVIEKKCHVKESSHIEESVFKKHESAIVKKNSETSSNRINNCDKIADNSSDSDEYEKFIQKEKKDLPKKSKKMSSNIKSQKSLKKVNRKCPTKSVSTEDESDLSDEELSNSSFKKMRKTPNMLDNRQSSFSEKNEPKKTSRKCKSKATFKYVSSSSDSEVSDGPSTSYKKRKKVHNQLKNRSSASSKEDSESQMDINDETYHNYSSESDDLPPPSEIMHGLVSGNSQFSAQMGDQPKSGLSLASNEAFSIPSMMSRDESNIPPLVNNNQPNISQNKTSCEIYNIASVESSDVPNVLHKSSDIHSLVGSAQLNVSCKTNDLSSLGNLHANNTLQIGSVPNNFQLENSPGSLIIDLGESDNECENSFTTIPKTSSQNQNNCHSYSEESEVELIDVIVPPELPVHAEHSDKKARYTKNSSNEFNIKIEKVDGTTLMTQPQNAKSNTESQTSFISKTYEVAYTTGICQKTDENNESKDKLRKQLNLSDDKLCNEKSKSEGIVKQSCLNNELQSSNVRSVKDSLVFNKKVKKEPSDGEECEIILDSTSISNFPTNLSNVHVHSNTNIKVKRETETVTQATAIHKDFISTRERSSVENSRNLHVLNKKVKEEPSDGGEECEIILDVTSISNSSTKFSNVQAYSNKNVKVEKDCKVVQATTMNILNDPIATRGNSKLTQKEQILEEVPCSTLTDLSSLHNKIVQSSENKTIDEPNPISIKALLENLKKEFATYQEILVTEQSVESTFKLLEKCQAERLKSIKTQIIQYLESAPINSESNSLKLAVNMLDNSESNKSTSLKDHTKVSSVCSSESSSTSDISMQDLKTLATMNLVPLSSISEKDIKPNLSELQYAVKQEPSEPYEINSMSFGEKCIVCAKDAAAACQQCAKVFFCSNECGRKYWEDGHKNACIK